MTDQEKIKWMERIKRLTEIRQRLYQLEREFEKELETIVIDVNSAIENGVKELQKGSE